VLDANVLYPARLRDLFLRLAIAGHYRALWTERILDECFNTPQNGPGTSSNPTPGTPLGLQNMQGHGVSAVCGMV
jgi:hypothetical protein